MARPSRDDLVLAAMASEGCEPFTPVQVQKLFFLIDKHLGKDLGGPYFDFQPYDYGPFDKDVYSELDALCARGSVAIAPDARTQRTYRLTPEGQMRGGAVLGDLDGPVKEHITELAVFVRSLSFAGLVSAVYQAYPEMRANSVFNG